MKLLDLYVIVFSTQLYFVLLSNFFEYAIAQIQTRFELNEYKKAVNYFMVSLAVIISLFLAINYKIILPLWLSFTLAVVMLIGSLGNLSKFL